MLVPLSVNEAVPVPVEVTGGTGNSCPKDSVAEYWFPGLGLLESPQAARAAQHNSIMPCRMFASHCSLPPAGPMGRPDRYFCTTADGEFMPTERYSTQAPRMGVHRHRTISHEAAERHAGRAGQIDRQGTGGGDAGNHRDARRRRLLHHLEARSAADQEHRGMTAGDLAVEHERADH